MKQLRIFFLILCFVMTSYFLIFSFSDISIAEQTRIQNCVTCCASKEQACFNINTDRRLCDVEFQNCVATCNSEGSSPSSWDDCWSQSGNDQI
jgi:hypothetical protein